MRFLYVVKWKPYSGRDGGLGKVRSFKATAKNSDDASNKLRKKGRVVSVRRVKRR